MSGSGLRAAIFIDLPSPSDVDDQVYDRLTEGYLSSPVDGSRPS